MNPILVLVVVWMVALPATVAAQSFSIPPKAPARATAAAPANGPAEVEGFINGKAARFYGGASGGVMLSAAEADRLGIRYRGVQSREIAGIMTNTVTLDTLKAGGVTSRDVQALVVPDPQRMLTAATANPMKVQSEGRKGTAEINGAKAQYYDFGYGGLVVAIEEADCIGLRYREGRKVGEGATTAWVVDVSVKLGDNATRMPVTVTNVQAFLERLQRELDSTRATPRTK